MSKFFISVLLFGFIVGCSDTDNSENVRGKFSRSECIVLVNFEFEDSKTSYVTSALADSIVLARQNNDFSSIAGGAFPNLTYRYKKAYLQLNKNCDDKTKIVNEYFERYWVLKDDDSVIYSVSDEVVQLSRRTIDLTGDSWSDD